MAAWLAGREEVREGGVGWGEGEGGWGEGRGSQVKGEGAHVVRGDRGEGFLRHGVETAVSDVT